MDLSLNSLLTNTTVQPQKSNGKSDAPVVRPGTDKPDDNIQSYAQPRAVETKSVEQLPPVSVVSALVSSVSILNEQPVTATVGAKRRSSDEHSPQTFTQATPEGQTANNVVSIDDRVRQVFSEINSRQTQAKSSDDERTAQSLQSFAAVDAKQGVEAYQAAGAAFGIGLTENSFDSGPAIFSPKNIIPVDIKV